jgi:dCTP deaminase
MPFWSSETVKKRVPEQGLIEPYDPQRVMRGAYELSVGSEAHTTSTTGEKTKLGVDERIIIPPGQFGLHVTKETVSVPSDAIAFLSIKSTIKLQGLVNVSGFHVDPGYKNTLKFAVYNAGPQDIYLDQGQPMFLIWYAALDQVTADVYVPRPGLSKSITAEDVKRIAGDVASPAELKKQIDEVKVNYDQRLQSVEQMQKIIQWLVGALILMILGNMLKAGWFDRVVELTTRSSGTVQTAQQASTPGAVTSATPPVLIPDHLGYYILGAGGIVGICSIVAAFIVRKRQK